MNNYITYYNIEGKILKDDTIIAFFGETLKKFKSIKAFKKAVSIYNYKYLGYVEANFKSRGYSNINPNFILRKNKEYNINYWKDKTIW